MHPSQTQYLVGRGPAPAITGPQLAAAHLMARLDGRQLPPFYLPPAGQPAGPHGVDASANRATQAAASGTPDNAHSQAQGQPESELLLDSNGKRASIAFVVLPVG